MYNSDIPRRADLPTSAQLVRATVFAAACASVILVTAVLPAEYAIDPTRVGRRLGLTQMGEIKIRLAAEAAADAAGRSTTAPATLRPVAPSQAPASPVSGAQRPFDAPAPSAQPTGIAARRETAPVQPGGRSDDVSFTLAPGQGAEFKLVMRRGARARFTWSSSGGPVNFDAHGDAPGQSTTYARGRSVDSDNGILQAAFDGNHGWFWRNRNNINVTVTLRTSGDYAELKRVL